MTGRHRIRPANRKDVVDVCGEIPYTLRAWALERDERVVAVGGYYMAQGYNVVFSDLAEPLPALVIMKAAKRLMEMVPAPAICRVTPGSERLLSALGWTDDGGDRWRIS